jgi:sugar phosphate isomerase/epimerase
MKKLPGYVLSTVAFRNHSLAEAIALAGELGYERLEIWQRHLFETPDEAWPDLIQQLEARGMTVPVVAPFLSYTRGADRLEQTHRDAARALELAARLGSTRFRLFTDVGPDGVASADATEEQWETAVREISVLCRNNPRLLFVTETHPHTLADGIAPIERLLREVGQPNFKLNFQPITPFLEAGLLGVVDRFFPQIAHMHWHQVPVGGGFDYLHAAGQVDFSALAAWLQDRGYAGTVTIEYCWPHAELEKIRQDVGILQSLPKFLA